MSQTAVPIGTQRYRESFGRHYEDFVVGDVYEHRPGRTITQIRDDIFLIDVIARGAELDRTSLDSIQNLQLATTTGTPIPLAAPVTTATFCLMLFSPLYSEPVFGSGVGGASLAAGGSGLGAAFSGCAATAGAETAGAGTAGAGTTPCPKTRSSAANAVSNWRFTNFCCSSATHRSA